MDLARCIAMRRSMCSATETEIDAD